MTFNVNISTFNNDDGKSLKIKSCSILLLTFLLKCLPELILISKDQEAHFNLCFPKDNKILDCNQYCQSLILIYKKKQS